MITVQRALHCNHRSGQLKTEHTESLFLLRRHLGNLPRSPAVSTSERTAGSAWETWTVAAADGVRFARVRWEMNFLLTFETAPLICKHPVYSEFTPLFRQDNVRTLKKLIVQILRFWRACSWLSSNRTIPSLTREHEWLERFTALSCKVKTRYASNSSPYIPNTEGNYGRHIVLSRGRDSSVGIATRYGPDGPGIEFRWGAIFFAPAQIGPGTHSASYTMGTGSFPGVKRPGRGIDHPSPSSAEVEGRVELYLYSPLWYFVACSRENFIVLSDDEVKTTVRCDRLLELRDDWWNYVEKWSDYDIIKSKYTSSPVSNIIIMRCRPIIENTFINIGADKSDELSTRRITIFYELYYNFIIEWNLK